MQAFAIHLDDATSPSVLTIEGDIDMATVDELREELDRALAHDADVVVDLERVTFLGVAGVRVFLRAAAALNGGGPLRFVHAERLVWLLDVIGLNDVDTIAICDAGHHGR
jgi:anti-anti-sigma factor